MTTLTAMAAPLQDNVPVSVLAELSARQVEAAITLVMQGGQCVATDRIPGGDAVLVIRTHIANARIVHDTTTVTINVVSSVTLGWSERDGQREFHRNYNEWVLRLVRDISTTLQQARRTKDNPQ